MGRKPFLRVGFPHRIKKKVCYLLRKLRMSTLPQLSNIRDIRKKLGLNQSEFWSKIGVTQSGGSRYESGRNMPKPVRELLRLVHIERVDLEKVNGRDYNLLKLLKEQEAETYHRLLKQLEKTENP